ncbi:MAG: hypothetical protein CSA81_14675 [Acidobacteria bacterium]|nr:MAG: hypothetical protein CSA81_14675 [Acidobacteriota bacterium]
MRKINMKIFFDGMGAVMDLAPRKKYLQRTYMAKNSSDAIRQDWEKVGKSLSIVMEGYVNANKK